MGEMSSDFEIKQKLALEGKEEFKKKHDVL
jgi:hypothetical protein